MNSVTTSLGLILISALTAACKTNERQVRQASIESLEADTAIDHRGTHEAPTQRDLQLRQRELVRRQGESPEDWRVGVALIRTTARLGDVDRARRYCRDFLAQSANVRRTNIACAEVEVVDGKLDLAEIMLSRLGDGRDASETAEIAGVKALISIERGKDQQAVALLKHGVSANPSNLHLRMNLGLLYLRYRHFEPAAKEFESILETAPGHVAANLHLAVIEAALGQDESAEQRLHRALGGHADTTWLALYNLALQQERREDYETLADTLNRLLQATDRRHPYRDELTEWASRNSEKLIEQRRQRELDQDV